MTEMAQPKLVHIPWEILLVKIWHVVRFISVARAVHVRRVHQLLRRVQAHWMLASAGQIFSPEVLAGHIFPLVSDALDEDHPTRALRKHEVP